MSDTLKVKVYYRLNGSSIPVLTATCLSYGSLCDFLGSPNRPGGHSAQPLAQIMLIHAHVCILR